MAIVWNKEALLDKGMDNIKAIMATRDRRAVNLNAYKPIFPKKYFGVKFPKKPIPTKIEHMAVAGDILPGLFVE